MGVTRFAVDISFDGLSPRSRAAAMLGSLDDPATPSDSATFPCANLAIASPRGAKVAIDHDLALVGSLRLWNLDRLRAAAGGEAETDADLILRAYRRHGVDAIASIDGDFAFVIWDDCERRAIAVRDRFGVAPLFIQRVDGGVRFASAVTMFAANGRLAPDDHTIAGYLGYRFDDPRRTFIDGVQRVPPATAVIVDPCADREIRYWPTAVPEVRRSAEDVTAGFREHLISAVERRVGTAHGVVAKLSGGFDSGSVTAAATVLQRWGRLAAPLTTASVLFPGSTADETRWIAATTAAQPFDHEATNATVPSIEDLLEDMRLTGGPLVSQIRDIALFPATEAQRTGADLVLEGVGGDEVLDQDQMLVDRVRTGGPTMWLRDATRTMLNDRRAAIRTARSLAGGVTPERVKDALRGRRSSTDIRTEGDTVWTPMEGDYPTWTQAGIVARTQHPSIAWHFETDGAATSRFGIDISAPFLDRDVVEFLASVNPADRPYDGRSKTIARLAFVDTMPAVVRSRSLGTVADDHLRMVTLALAPAFIDRYPRVSAAADGLIDRTVYERQVAAVRTGSAADGDLWSLWAAWTTMAWLDELGHHG